MIEQTKTYNMLQTELNPNYNDVLYDRADKDLQYAANRIKIGHSIVKICLKLAFTNIRKLPFC